MITRLSIAFEDFLGSSIAPQVMLPCLTNVTIVGTSHKKKVKIVLALNNGVGLSSWVALAYQVALVFDKWWSST